LFSAIDAQVIQSRDDCALPLNACAAFDQAPVNRSNEPQCVFVFHRISIRQPRPESLWFICHIWFLIRFRTGCESAGCKRFDFPEIKLEKIEPKLLEHWPEPTV
jgi:hypothetical protein